MALNNVQVHNLKRAAIMASCRIKAERLSDRVLPRMDFETKMRRIASFRAYVHCSSICPWDKPDLKEFHAHSETIMDALRKSESEIKPTIDHLFKEELATFFLKSRHPDFVNAQFTLSKPTGRILQLGSANGSNHFRGPRSAMPTLDVVESRPDHTAYQGRLGAWRKAQLV